MEQVVEISITCSSSAQRVIRVGAGDCLMFVEISFKKKILCVDPASGGRGDH